MRTQILPYVTNSASDNVSVINAGTNTTSTLIELAASVSHGFNPLEIAITPTTKLMTVIIG